MNPITGSQLENPIEQEDISDLLKKAGYTQPHTEQASDNNQRKNIDLSESEDDEDESIIILSQTLKLEKINKKIENAQILSLIDASRRTYLSPTEKQEAIIHYIEALSSNDTSEDNISELTKILNSSEYNNDDVELIKATLLQLSPKSLYELMVAKNYNKHLIQLLDSCNQNLWLTKIATHLSTLSKGAEEDKFKCRDFILNLEKTNSDILLKIMGAFETSTAAKFIEDMQGVFTDDQTRQRIFDGFFSATISHIWNDEQIRQTYEALKTDDSLYQSFLANLGGKQLLSLIYSYKGDANNQRECVRKMLHPQLVEKIIADISNFDIEYVKGFSAESLELLKGNTDLKAALEEKFRNTVEIKAKVETNAQLSTLITNLVSACTKTSAILKKAATLEEQTKTAFELLLLSPSENEQISSDDIATAINQLSPESLLKIQAKLKDPAMQKLFITMLDGNSLNEIKKSKKGDDLYSYVNDLDDASLLKIIVASKDDGFLLTCLDYARLQSFLATIVYQGYKTEDERIENLAFADILSKLTREQVVKIIDISPFKAELKQKISIESFEKKAKENFTSNLTDQIDSFFDMNQNPNEHIKQLIKRMTSANPTPENLKALEALKQGAGVLSSATTKQNAKEACEAALYVFFAQTYQNFQRNFNDALSKYCPKALKDTDGNLIKDFHSADLDFLAHVTEVGNFQEVVSRNAESLASELRDRIDQAGLAAAAKLEQAITSFLASSLNVLNATHRLIIESLTQVAPTNAENIGNKIATMLMEVSSEESLFAYANEIKQQYKDNTELAKQLDNLAVLNAERCAYIKHINAEAKESTAESQQELLESIKIVFKEADILDVIKVMAGLGSKERREFFIKGIGPERFLNITEYLNPNNISDLEEIKFTVQNYLGKSYEAFGSTFQEEIMLHFSGTNLVAMLSGMEEQKASIFLKRMSGAIINILRSSELEKLKDLLTKHPEMVLNIIKSPDNVAQLNALKGYQLTEIYKFLIENKPELISNFVKALNINSLIGINECLPSEHISSFIDVMGVANYIKILIRDNCESVGKIETKDMPLILAKISASLENQEMQAFLKTCSAQDLFKLNSIFADPKINPKPGTKLDFIKKVDFISALKIISLTENKNQCEEYMKCIQFAEKIKSLSPENQLRINELDGATLNKINSLVMVNPGKSYENWLNNINGDSLAKIIEHQLKDPKNKQDEFILYLCLNYSDIFEQKLAGSDILRQQLGAQTPKSYIHSKILNYYGENPDTAVNFDLIIKTADETTPSEQLTVLLKQRNKDFCEAWFTNQLEHKTKEKICFLYKEATYKMLGETLNFFTKTSPAGIENVFGKNVSSFIEIISIAENYENRDMANAEERCKKLFEKAGTKADFLIFLKYKSRTLSPIGQYLCLSSINDAKFVDFFKQCTEEELKACFANEDKDLFLAAINKLGTAFKADGDNDLQKQIEKLVKGSPAIQNLIIANCAIGPQAAENPPQYSKFALNFFIANCFSKESTEALLKTISPQRFWEIIQYNRDTDKNAGNNKSLFAALPADRLLAFFEYLRQTDPKLGLLGYFITNFCPQEQKSNFLSRCSYSDIAKITEFNREEKDTKSNKDLLAELKNIASQDRPGPTRLDNFIDYLANTPESVQEETGLLGYLINDCLGSEEYFSKLPVNKLVEALHYGYFKDTITKENKNVFLRLFSTKYSGKITDFFKLLTPDKLIDLVIFLSTSTKEEKDREKDYNELYNYVIDSCLTDDLIESLIKNIDTEHLAKIIAHNYEKGDGKNERWLSACSKEPGGEIDKLVKHLLGDGQANLLKSCLCANQDDVLTQAILKNITVAHFIKMSNAEPENSPTLKIIDGIFSKIWPDIVSRMQVNTYTDNEPEASKQYINDFFKRITNWKNTAIIPYEITKETNQTILVFLNKQDITANHVLFFLDSLNQDVLGELFSNKEIEQKLYKLFSCQDGQVDKKNQNKDYLSGLQACNNNSNLRTLFLKQVLLDLHVDEIVTKKIAGLAASGLSKAHFDLLIEDLLKYKKDHDLSSKDDDLANSLTVFVLDQMHDKLCTVDHDEAEDACRTEIITIENEFIGRAYNNIGMLHDPLHESAQLMIGGMQVDVLRIIPTANDDNPPLANRPEDEQSIITQSKEIISNIKKCVVVGAAINNKNEAIKKDIADKQFDKLKKKVTTFATACQAKAGPEVPLTCAGFFVNFFKVFITSLKLDTSTAEEWIQVATARDTAGCTTSWIKKGIENNIERAKNLAKQTENVAALSERIEALKAKITRMN